MVVGEEQTVIPIPVWNVVDFKREQLADEARKKSSKTGVKRNCKKGFYLRKFYYNVSRRCWTVGCGCHEEQNLFFEYILSSSSEMDSDFIAVQFGDGTENSSHDSNHNHNIRNDTYHTHNYRSDQFRELMLRQGLQSPNGDHFHILGCSNSQIKNFSFIFRRCHVALENERLLGTILPQLDKLEKEKGIAKRIKYTGLLFSGVRAFVELPNDGSLIVQEIESKQTPNFDFTDGPGLISIKLAKEIQRQMNLFDEDDPPSVFQIRYGGAVRMLNGKDEAFVCKGVLLVDPYEENRNVLSFRKSMLKIGLQHSADNNFKKKKGKTTADKKKVNGWQVHMGHKLGIVDYSRRIIGKMNQQLICLLSANIPEKDLLDIQSFHLNAVRLCHSDALYLGYLVAMDTNPKMWNLYKRFLLRDCSSMNSDDVGDNNNRMPSSFLTLVQRRNRFCNESKKLQIQLSSSRTLFGAVFPEILHYYLKEGQCLIFTDHGLLVEDAVIVSRSPSYSPGDIRILEAVTLPNEKDYQSLKKFRNCILFATQGTRPESDKMSGGDMDGDLYLVIWDTRITKYASKLRCQEAANYDAPVQKETLNPDALTIHKEDWIAYAARFDNSMLGKVDSAFYATAKEKGINSKEAKSLNLIFSSLVDKNQASLDKFDRLVGSIYNTSKTQMTSSSEGVSCVWEIMLTRQLQCTKEIRSSGIVPNKNMYLSFQKEIFSRGGPWKMVGQRIESSSSFLEHFTSSVSLQELTSFLKSLERAGKQQYLCDQVDGLLSKSNNDSAYLSVERERNDHINEQLKIVAEWDTRFNENYLRWKRRAISIYQGPLNEWDKERRGVLESIKKEQILKNIQLDKFDKEHESIYQQLLQSQQELNMIKDVKVARDLYEKKNALKDEENRLKVILKDVKNDRRKKIVFNQANVSSLNERRITATKNMGLVDTKILSLPSPSFYDFLFGNKKRSELLNTKKMLEEELCHLKRLNEDLYVRKNQEIRICNKKVISISDQLSQNVSKLNEIEDEIKGNLFSLSDMEHADTSFALESQINLLKLLVQQKQKELITVDLDREEFLSGTRRDELNFEVNQNKEKLNLQRLQLQNLKDDQVNIQSSLKKLEKIKIRMEKAYSKAMSMEDGIKKLQTDLEKYLCGKKYDIEGYFTGDMLSESSYLTLKKNATELDLLTNTQHFQLSDSLVPLAQRKVCCGRNENKTELKYFFDDAKKALCILKTHHTTNEINMKNELTVLKKDIDDLNSTKALQREEKVVLDKELKLTRKRINMIKKKITKTKEEGSLHDDCSIDILDTENAQLSEKSQQLLIMRKEKESLSTKNNKVLSKLLTKRKNLIFSRDKFKKLYSIFEEEARMVMNGELVDGIPMSIFTDIFEIVDNVHVLIDLSNEFKSFNERSSHLADPEFFNQCAVFLDSARELYSPEHLFKLNQELSELKNELDASCIKLQLKEAEEKRRFQEYCDTYRDVKRLEEQIASQHKDLDEIFNPNRLQDLEFEWQNTAHEDSMKVGINHINHVIKSIKQEWECVRNKGDNKILQSILLRMNNRCLNVCKQEENRILGFPKMGKREGRMPVYDKRAELLQAMTDNDVVIITAGTGCGKSTQLPQYIADDFYAHTHTLPIGKREFFRVCCTQPRRVAAQKVAKRVADEYLTDLGDLVGYRVGMRGSNVANSIKITTKTVIEFVTEGWLLYNITKSPDKLCNYDCVILDEAHERNLETDLLMALLRRHILQNDISSMKVVVMSATIDPGKFCHYFGNCPSVDCPGKIFPVEQLYRPAPSNDGGANVSHAVDVLFNEILENFGNESNYEEGDCLIFLSGANQITECVDQINSRAIKQDKSHVVAYPLYAQMSDSDKDAAVEPDHRTGLDKHTDGKHKLSRKVICCTNIAETSLTIDKVRFIIEGGYAKKVTYNHLIRSKALSEVRISKASAKQRKGRAGRTAPGRCYYLYSEETYENMVDHEKPLIMATPVDQLILFSLKINGTSLESLGLIDCPDISDICNAKERLTDLGMIQRLDDENEIKLTGDGLIATRLTTLEPQAVRMILASRLPPLNCLNRAIQLGSIMSSEDHIFCRRRDKDEKVELQSKVPHYLGDHFYALEFMRKFEKEKAKTKKGKDKFLKIWCAKNGLVFHVISQIQCTIEQCYRELKRSKMLINMHTSDDDEECLLRACIAGYFSHLAEYNDAVLAKELGFTLLTPVLGDQDNQNHICCRIQLKLGRESFINELIDEEKDLDDNNYIDEEEEEDCNPSTDKEERNQVMIGSDGDPPAKTSVSFILYGTLMSIETYKRGSINLIQNGTLINNGRLIEEHAPKSWLSRVKFDPDKPSVCKQVISSISRQCLMSLQYRLKNEKPDGILITVQWNKCCITLYGQQDDVSSYNLKLQNYIEVDKKNKIRVDSAKLIPSTKVFTHKHFIVIFGCGLQVKAIETKGKEETPSVSKFIVGKILHIQPIEHLKDYWSVLHRKCKLIIYTRACRSSIFLQNLKKALANCNYSFKRGDRSIEVSLKGSAINRKGAMVIRESLLEHASIFHPDIVDINSLTEDTVNVKSRTISLWVDMWYNIKKDWNVNSTFWKFFCKDMAYKYDHVQVSYIPSGDCFHIFATDNGTRDKVKCALIENLVKMLETSLQYLINISAYPRWKLRQLVSKVGEIRLKFPQLCFNIRMETQIPSNILTEFEQIEYMEIEQLDMKFISINVQSKGKYAEMKMAIEIIQKNFVPTLLETAETNDFIVTNTNDAKKGAKCCMCRRRVNDKGGEGIESILSRSEDIVPGWRLTLCGCLFCRQCFLNFTVAKLRIFDTVQCARCDSDILAKDCEKITNPLYKRKNVAPVYRQEAGQYESDWRSLATLSIAKYCSDLAELSHDKSFVCCPDCSTAMIYGTNLSFFYCRNERCPNQFCSRCGEVVTQVTHERCKNNLCFR